MLLTPLPGSMPGMKTSMRNISKVKQSRLKPSRPLLPQPNCTATDSCRLGEVRVLGPLMTTLTTRVGDVYATFNFRYRSRSESPIKYTSTMLIPAEDLQTLRLIPRSPSPVPLEDRPEESLNREELLELLRRQKVQTDVLLDRKSY
jgi:hypothetical protein